MSGQGDGIIREIDQLEANNAQFKQQMLALLQQIDGITKTAVEQSVSSSRSQIQSLQTDVEQKRTQIDKLQKQIEQIELQTKQQHFQNAIAIAKVNDLQEEVFNLQEDVSKLQRQIDEQQRKYNADCDQRLHHIWEKIQQLKQTITTSNTEVLNAARTHVNGAGASSSGGQQPVHVAAAAPIRHRQTGGVKRTKRKKYASNRYRHKHKTSWLR